MVHETTKRDPERIYLEPWPYSPEGRLWSEENVWPLYTWPPEPEGESERASGVEYIRADLHAAEIARLTRELEAAREREQGYREALSRALDRGFPGDTHEGDCAVTRGMQCDCWIGQARALASTPPDTEGGEAEPPAHPVRMAQPDEEVAL